MNAAARMLTFLVALVLTGVAGSCNKRDTGTASPDGTVPGDDTTDFKPQPLDYQVSTLDNGMQVVTLEDASTPIAAVQVWYHVGSKDEKKNRRGFAHMFEHMMFRGTQNIGPKAHFEYIRKVGGNANAFTSFDNTTYIQEVPSNQVEMVLWLEAERMAFLKINEGYFDTERKVVAEEYRMGREQPYGTVPDKLLPQIFTKHPYAWTPIGDMDELAAADASELQEFWETYYVPNNAALVVVGDVKHEDIVAKAQKYFGWIPKYPEPPRVAIEEPQRSEPLKIKIKERKGPVPIVGIGWRTVPMGHPDELALEVLGNILGGGESSRLYRDLVTDKDLAMFALSAGFTLEDDGIFAAGAVLSPLGGKPDTTLAAIRAQIERIKNDGVTPEELRKAKNNLLRDAVASRVTVASKAQLLGEAALIKDDLDSVNRELIEIENLSVDDIDRVANAYLDPQREIEIRVEPSLLGMLVDSFKGGDEAEKTEESYGAEEISGEGAGKPGLVRPDTIGKAPPVAPPLDAEIDIATQSKTLDNGLKVVVVPSNEIPYVTYVLGLEYGAFADPKDAPGTAYLAAPMLTRGTKSHPYEELSQALDERAISISGSASMDSSQVVATALSNQAGRTMELLSEVVTQPTFPAEELKKYVSQTVTGLAITQRSPEYLAERELRRHMFAGHPYERLPEGTSAGLQKIEAETLAQWWKTYARPDAAVLYVAGDIQPDDAFALAEQYLGGWKAQGAKPPIEVAAPPAPSKTKIYLVNRESDQAQIRVGHVGITRDDDLYPRTRVLTEVFGGGFNARLNDTIRVKKGLTYGASGGFGADRFAGRFVIRTFSKNSTVGETVSTILEEIDRLETEAPSKKEQSEAISFILGSFARQRETPQAVVGDLWTLHLEGLPEDWYSNYLDQVREVKSEQVLEAAKKLVEKDSLVIVVVGDAKVLEPQLRNIAEVEVVEP